MEKPDSLHRMALDLFVSIYTEFLGDTILRKGVKVDNLVHIAHNVVIGENSLIIADAMVGGSTIIGKNTWVAPATAIR